MPTIPYTGSITLEYGSPNTCSNGSPLPSKNLQTNNQAIEWKTDNVLPSGFPSKISQFSKYANLIDLTYTLDIDVLGYPSSDGAGEGLPIIDVVILDQNENAYPTFFLDTSTNPIPNNPIKYSGVYQYYRNENNPYSIPADCLQPCTSQNCGSQNCSCCGPNNCYKYAKSAYNYCLTNTPPFPWQNETFYPAGIYAVAYFYCNSGNCNDGLCTCHHYTNFNITLTLNVTANLICTGGNLENSFCTQYCNYPYNYQNCINDMNAYCFSPSDNPYVMPMGISNGECQKFYPNYIQSSLGGPSSEIDTGLSNYCSKYGSGPTGENGMNDLFAGNASVQDQEICACHLNSNQYAAYRQSLLGYFPGFNALDESAPCLVWQCANSPYKSEATTGTCNTPECLNIYSFDNDGGFILGSNFNIVQNQTCSKYTGNQTPIKKSSKIIFIIAIILAILLIIILVGYLAL